MVCPITRKKCLICKYSTMVSKTNKEPLCKSCTESKCVVNGRCNNMFPMKSRNDKTYCLGHWKDLCYKGCHSCGSRAQLTFAMDAYAYCYQCKPTFHTLKAELISKLNLPNDIVDIVFSTSQRLKLWS